LEGAISITEADMRATIIGSLVLAVLGGLLMGITVWEKKSNTAQDDCYAMTAPAQPTICN
jgi:hypothetical protein